MIYHRREDLQRFATIITQKSYRLGYILTFIKESGTHLSDIDIVMGRGGLLHPLEGGVYAVSSDMLEDLDISRYGEHACNLGAGLAYELAQKASCRAFIADPVVVDEMIPEARISGMPEIERKSIFHALNQKIAAREIADKLSLPYEQTRMIVVHLGGGISIGAHRYGKVIDVNNALDGEGPFSPERSGGVPAGDLVRLTLSGSYSRETLQKKICGHGGMAAYMGTSDIKLIEQQARDGDEKSSFYLRAMLYQIAKEIGALATVLQGKVDAIVLTGGMTKSSSIVEELQKRVAYLAPIYVIPGEREMLSLAENGLAVYNGTREVREYVRV